VDVGNVLERAIDGDADRLEAAQAVLRRAGAGAERDPLDSLLVTATREYLRWIVDGDRIPAASQLEEGRVVELASELGLDPVRLAIRLGLSSARVSAIGRQVFRKLPETQRRKELIGLHQQITNDVLKDLSGERGSTIVGVTVSALQSELIAQYIAQMTLDQERTPAKLSSSERKWELRVSDWQTLDGFIRREIGTPSHG
jgi:DNA-binding CsgD family transcriptional regulator